MKLERMRAVLHACFVALQLLLSACLSLANATTVAIPSSADTHVRSANPNANFGAWTTNMVGLEANKSGSSPITSRALLHFDVSSLPSGALIKNATIRLYIDDVVQNPADPGALLITAWPLGTSFVEVDGTSGVTWSSQPAALGWPNHTEPMAASAGQWFEMDVTQLVEGRLASSDPGNVRILIGATDESINEVRHFFLRSKEHGTGAHGPELVVDYATGLSSISITASAEALLSSYQPDSNFGESSYSWILRNSASTMRSVSHFDMSGLPGGAVVEHAEIRCRSDPPWWSIRCFSVGLKPAGCRARSSRTRLRGTTSHRLIRAHGPFRIWGRSLMRHLKST